MIFLLIVILTVFVYYHMCHKRRGLPPGPRPLPIFGNLLEILRDPPGEQVFLKWRKKYGKVYTYFAGSNPIVAVADFQTIIDTFQRDGEAYEDRFKFVEMTTIVRGGLYGLIMTDGDHWREQKRLVTRFLSDLGIGKKSLQSRFLDEIQRIQQRIDQQLDSNPKQEHDISGHCRLAAGSLINWLLFGFGFEDEREFYELANRFDQHNKAILHPIMLLAMCAPKFFMRVPVVNKYLKIVCETGKFLLEYFRQRAKKCIKDFDPSEENPTSFVHAFVREWRLRDEIGAKHYFSEDQLVSICYDLWFAGHESSSVTLAWGFAFLILHPEIQSKCQAELDNIVGHSQIITMSERPNLPYCLATVFEIQRLANIVPQNVLHKTTRDVVIEGHRIAKGTTIVPQISAILFDEQIFPDAKAFRPERFLDANGKFQALPEFIPFSVGKRRCSGEAMGEMELFLIVCNLLQKYKFFPGKKMPSMKRNFGATVSIEPYLCRIEKRHSEDV